MVNRTQNKDDIIQEIASKYIEERYDFLEE